MSTNSSITDQQSPTAQPILRVLVIEDSQLDVDLCFHALRKANVRFVADIVKTEEEFLQKVRSERYDVILSDYNLPSWSGLAAFDCLKREGIQIPFILVTGTLGEEAAVECIKRGISDYVLKDRLARLPFAIERAIQDQANRNTQAALSNELQQSEERYALASRGANDGLWDWNIAADQIYFSDRWKAMLGYVPGDVGQRPEDWLSRVHSDDRKIMQEKLEEHWKGTTSHFEHEQRVRHADGTFRWMLSRGMALRDKEGHAYRMAGSQTDITQHKLAEEQLAHNAFHDPLTGLPNRALFINRLELALANSRRRGVAGFAVVYLDLDKFKNVNDSIGHSGGDQLLCGAAARLKTCLRPGDTVARLGGDEFAILLTNVEGVNAAVHVVERIERVLSVPFLLQGQDFSVTAALGVAMNHGNYSQPDEILKDADAAMYRAKSSGKAHHEVYDRAMHEHAMNLVAMEAELRRAIESQNLRVFYQPIVSLRSRRVTGVEALARWERSDGFLASAESFIPLAEDSGLIVPLGQQVVQTACKQAKRWLDDGCDPFRVSINLSSRELKQQGLPAHLRSVLDETRLLPDCVELELSERKVLSEFDPGVIPLQQLAEIGVRLAVDDFGTGASSLAALRDFSIGALKIDRSFIHDLIGKPESAALVKAAIGLAHSFDMKAIAEGVETPEQLELLQLLGCDEAQGFFISPPVPETRFSQFLSSGCSWLDAPLSFPPPDSLPN
jgi:diguanylate cyclase (GGDEF)-like protein/PAS domain S-box-containing protein